ncbi:MAG: hypothetical protein DMG57_14530 [Acidobacteria bacterium]|nr:MAG: hypothetical protein DMG57_14530 [Acidobacteriota bacterium]
MEATLASREQRLAQRLLLTGLDACCERSVYLRAGIDERNFTSFCRRAGACPATIVAPSVSGLRISMFPLKQPPSSILMRAVFKSPKRGRGAADFQLVRHFQVAFELAFNYHVAAITLACTPASGPTVSRQPGM